MWAKEMSRRAQYCTQHGVAVGSSAYYAKFGNTVRQHPEWNTLDAEEVRYMGARAMARATELLPLIGLMLLKAGNAVSNACLVSSLQCIDLGG